PVSPAACWRNGSGTPFGRRRLPMWSARNGGRPAGAGIMALPCLLGYTIIRMSQQPAPRVKSAKPKRRTAEIVAAAAQVFARRGYHGASTQDIADGLGIRQASPHYYFDSKEAAQGAVCTEGMPDYGLLAPRIARR